MGQRIRDCQAGLAFLKNLMVLNHIGYLVQ